MQTTKRASSSVRSRQEDEFDSFLEKDKTTFEGLHAQLICSNSRTFVTPVTVFIVDGALNIQSQQFFHGTPMFLVKIFDNLCFETFHCGIKCYIFSLLKNYVTTIDSWSKLEECIRFFNSLEIDNQKNVIQQQVTAMAPQTVGFHVYGPKIIVRAFEYFATSRSLYNRIRNDYKLPSIQLLLELRQKSQRLTKMHFLMVYSRL